LTYHPAGAVQKGKCSGKPEISQKRNGGQLWLCELEMEGEARRKQGKGEDSSSKETIGRSGINETLKWSRRTYAFAAIERQVKDNLMRDIVVLLV